MFGLLTPSGDYLSEEQYRRYRSYYCGLCRSLGERHGQTGRLTLTYDLTFLTILLESLYEPEIRTGEQACIAHPLKKHEWRRSEITEYAADLNVALAYYKCLDGWIDEYDPMMKAAAAALRGKYRRVEERLPRQCAAIRSGMESLDRLEQSGTSDVDACADCFGVLLGELFVYRQDRWEPHLREFGRQLGRFIYLADAMIDLEDDLRAGRFNPLAEYAGREDNAEFFREVLNITLGDCIRPFDMLPLVEDVELMKNILCEGVWFEFNKKFQRERGSSDVPGSL